MPTSSEDYYRDQIADLLAGQSKANTSLGKTMAALPQNMQMATAMPQGMPQTPAGGVPGSGLAPAGPSIVSSPPQVSMGGPMPGATPIRPMGGGAGGSPPLGGMGMPLPTAMPAMPTTMPGGSSPWSPPETGGVDQAGLMPRRNDGARRLRGY